MASTGKSQQAGVPVSWVGPACCSAVSCPGAWPSASSAGILPFTGLPHLCQRLGGLGDVGGIILGAGKWATRFPRDSGLPFCPALHIAEPQLQRHMASQVHRHTERDTHS